jgi:surface antigen
MNTRRLTIILLLFLSCAFITTSFISERKQPTKALLAQNIKPFQFEWDEIKFIEDEKGDADEINTIEGIEKLREPNRAVSSSYGAVLDSLNGVYVYNSKGSGKRGKRRHKTEDGYNLGLKWQCVEFVKRYYYEHFGHKMPKDRGHAKSFFNKRLKDGEFNKDRGLYQFSCYSVHKPKVNEIIVFTNKGNYGHVAIISSVEEDRIEITEQNSSMTRREYWLERTEEGKWHIKNRNKNEFVLGRLGFYPNFEEIKD